MRVSPETVAPASCDRRCASRTSVALSKGGGSGGDTAGTSSSDELDTTICLRRCAVSSPMVISLFSRRAGSPVYLFFVTGSSSAGRFPRSFSRAYAVQPSPSSPSSSFGLSSLASGSAGHRGPLGGASTPHGQAAVGITEKCTAQSCSQTFKQSNQKRQINKNNSSDESRRLVLGAEGLQR